MLYPKGVRTKYLFASGSLPSLTSTSGSLAFPGWTTTPSHITGQLITARNVGSVANRFEPPPQRFAQLVGCGSTDPEFESGSAGQTDRTFMQASSAAPQIAGVVGEFDEHVVIDRSRRLLVEVIVGSDSHRAPRQALFLWWR